MTQTLPPVIRTNLLERLLRYVQIWTEPNSENPGTPSSERQWDLLKLLRDELRELGAHDVTLTQHGYVLATIPATAPRADIPTIAFLAHVDTANDFTGENVTPLVHQKYSGDPIHYPKAPDRILDRKLFPQLDNYLGQTLVTTSGDTLLGADDKAGVAIAMTTVEYLLAHPEIPHGKIRICFNPDEEIGRGFEGLETTEIGADVAYTIDGEESGDLNYETFSADMAEIVIKGVSIHPGTAYDKLVSAIKLGSEIVAAIGKHYPGAEQSRDREGFIHAIGFHGSPALVKLSFLIRDFELSGLKEKGEAIRSVCHSVQSSSPKASIECHIREQYRNMRDRLAEDMRPVTIARAAMRAIGIEPVDRPIRGGTDGSILTARGLPTPNIFSGAHNCHGPFEWVTVEEMEKAVFLCAEIAKLWGLEKRTSNDS